MAYDPRTHHRRSIRLKGYDYSQAGTCFITICCNDKKCHFGNVGAPLAGAHGAQGAEMILNEYGWIAYNEWVILGERFSNFELDVFQVMPNHFHAIVLLNDVRAPLAGAPADVANDVAGVFNGGAGASPAPTDAPTGLVVLGDMAGAYKSLAANGCLEIYKSKNRIMRKLWQRNFYEHIIRDEKSYRILTLLLPYWLVKVKLIIPPVCPPPAFGKVILSCKK